MPVLIAVWFALVGGLAALVGLAGMRRVRRLRLARADHLGGGGASAGRSRQPS